MELDGTWAKARTIGPDVSPRMRERVHADDLGDGGRAGAAARPSRSPGIVRSAVGRQGRRQPYAGGTTICDIQHHLAATIGTDLSPETISNFAAGLMPSPRRVGETAGPRRGCRLFRGCR